MESNKTIVFHCSQLDLVTNLIEEKLTMKKGEYTLFIIYKKRDVFDLFSGYEAVVRTSVVQSCRHYRGHLLAMSIVQ